MQWLPARLLLQESPRPPPVPRHMAVQCRPHTPPHPLAQHSALELYRAVQITERSCCVLRGEDRTGGRGWPDWRPSQQQPPASLSRSIQLLLLLLLRLAGLRLDS